MVLEYFKITCEINENSFILKSKNEEVVEQRPQTIDKPREQRATTTTTTIATTTTATDNSNQQKQLSTLDEQNDSKESEPKTATSPQKSKVKGDRISKLQVHTFTFILLAREIIILP